MGRKHGFLILLAVFMGVAVAVDYQGKALSLKMAAEDKTRYLKHIYSLGFKLEKTPIGSLNAYLPKYRVVDEGLAKHYFSLFGLSEDLRETDDYFLCGSESEVVRVFKFGNRIDYRVVNESVQSKSSVQLSDEEAIEKAAEFIESKGLFLGYEESEVSLEPNGRRVRFIGRLGNIKNYAFDTYCIVGSGGSVLEMSYSYMNYERLGASKIKSMANAFLELPENIGDKPIDAIDLSRCELVYIYDDSIVQPAYMFEGSYPDGDVFRCFVPAALFDAAS